MIHVGITSKNTFEAIKDGETNICVLETNKQHRQGMVFVGDYIAINAIEHYSADELKDGLVDLSADQFNYTTRLDNKGSLVVRVNKVLGNEFIADEKYTVVGFTPCHVQNIKNKKPSVV